MTTRLVFDDPQKRNLFMRQLRQMDIASYVVQPYVNVGTKHDSKDDWHKWLYGVELPEQLKAYGLNVHSSVSELPLGPYQIDTPTNIREQPEPLQLRDAGFDTRTGKARIVRGDNHGKRKLSNMSVILIYWLSDHYGLAHHKLAEIADVSRTNISKILRGELWWHMLQYRR